MNSNKYISIQYFIKSFFSVLHDFMNVFTNRVIT